MNHDLTPPKIKTRKIWMFPRNIRDIRPWKLHQILNVLMQFNGNCDLSSHQAQIDMYHLLNEVGVKCAADLHDFNPGGMRTYFAQLTCLGLVYKKRNESDYKLTIAGQRIIDGDNPIKVLQYALLTHQFPSTYSTGQNVKIDTKIKVKPFVFLLRLLHDERLGYYLTSDDACVPVIFGHNNDCYEFCVSKIVEARSSGNLLDCLEDKQVVFTPRGNKTDYKKAMSNIKDIANTAMNYLQASDLVLPNGKLVFGKKAWIANDCYEDFYQQQLANQDNFIPHSELAESFQRAYGKCDMLKDTRRNDIPGTKQKSGAETLIQIKYIQYLNENPFKGDAAAEFIPKLSLYGLKQIEIEQIIAPLEERKDSIEENAYLEFAFSGGTKSEEFEKATTELMKDFGFIQSRWIGRVQSHENWRGNFPDVLIQEEGSLAVGLADAKSTATYNLQHDDMLKLRETYSKSNNELVHGSTLKYFLYIAGGFKGNIEGSIKQVSEAIGVPVTAITARAMLEIKKSLSKGWTADFIQKKFFELGALVTADTVMLTM